MSDELLPYVRHKRQCGVWEAPPEACTCGLAAILARREAKLDRTEENRCAALMARDDAVFVFGSNRAGRHGAGAARAALDLYGAEYGVGEGLRGRSYALPTKDDRIHTLSLPEILQHVRKFLAFAEQHPEKCFVVTRIGCGLAGYTDAQIAPLFIGVPSNCHLPKGWSDAFHKGTEP